MEVLQAFPRGFGGKENRLTIPISISEQKLFLRPCLAPRLRISLCIVLFPPPRIKAIQPVRDVRLGTNSLLYTQARIRTSLANVSVVVVEI